MLQVTHNRWMKPGIGNPKSNQPWFAWNTPTSSAIQFQVGLSYAFIACLAVFGGIANFSENAQADQKGATPPVVTIASESVSTEESLEQLVAQLGEPRYQTRLGAFHKLWQKGPSVLPQVHQLAKEDSKVVAESIDTLELLLHLNISPNRDEKLVELIQSAQRANHNSLFELCGKGHWKIAQELLTKNPKLSVALKSSFIYYRLNDLVDKAVEQGDPALAWPIVQQLVPPEEFIWLSLQQEAQPTSIDPQNKHLQAMRLLFEDRPSDALAIPQLNPKTRMRIALTGGRWELLLEPTVADTMFGALHPTPSRRAAQLAAMHLNGQSIREPVQELYRDLGWIAPESDANKIPANQQSSETPSGPLGKLASNPTEFTRFINALILAGRAQDAGQILQSVRDPETFSYFVSRSDYTQAFLTVGLKADVSNFAEWIANIQEKLTLQLRGGNSQEFETMTNLNGALLSLGFEEQGKQLLEILVEVARDGSRIQASSNQAACWDKLADALERSQVRVHLLSLVKREFGSFNRDTRMRVLGNLYPEWSEIAPALLATAPLAQFAGQEVSKWELMEQLWRLEREAFGPQASGVLEKWLNQAEEHLANEEEFTDSHAQQFMKLAGQLRLPELAYEHAVGKHQRLINWSALAELAMRRGDLDSAADYFSRARDPDTTRLDWLLQEITARTLAGQAEQASILNTSLVYRPLAIARSSGESTYTSVAQHLLEQGQPAMAEQFARAGFMLAPAPGPEFYLASLTLANSYEKQENFLRAADTRRALALTFLSPAFAVPRYSMLLSFAQKECSQRAVGLLARGDIDAAQRCMEAAQLLHPLGIELVEDCYPGLTKLGHTDVADALFAGFEQRILEHLKTWPKDATNHNNLAWMYARCQKHLDRALHHAQIATTLAPRSATLLDTLAEVYFCLGQRAQAIDVAKECIRLDPREPHYQEQLTRFLSASHPSQVTGE